MAVKKQVIEAEQTPTLYCLKCGKSDPKNFYQTLDPDRSFFKKIPYCKDCIREIYKEYCVANNDNGDLAMYYLCRKIDVPYIHTAYLGAVENIKNPNSRIRGEAGIVSAYMKNLSFGGNNGWGNTFDASIGIEDIGGIPDVANFIRVTKAKELMEKRLEGYETIEYDSAVLIQKWGIFDEDTLAYLEGEYLDWSDKLGGITEKSTEILVKEICYQCNDIRKGREQGTDVTKMVSTLQATLKTSGLIEMQQSKEQEKPIGQRLADIELHRPVREERPELKDVDNIERLLYGFIGPTLRSLGKENGYTAKFDELYAPYDIDIISNIKNDLISSQEVDANDNQS